MSSTDTIIVVEKLYPDVELPEYATAGSAAMDVKAYVKGVQVTTYTESNKKYQQLVVDGVPVVVYPRERVLIPLGFKGKIPEGYQVKVLPRSGKALKEGVIVSNSPGTIDSDYPGEWGVILHNTSESKLEINHGDKIAQIELQPVYRMQFEEGVVEQTTERVGGFGSTGT